MLVFCYDNNYCSEGTLGLWKLVWWGSWGLQERSISSTEYHGHKLCPIVLSSVWADSGFAGWVSYQPQSWCISGLLAQVVWKLTWCPAHFLHPARWRRSWYCSLAPGVCTAVQPACSGSDPLSLTKGRPWYWLRSCLGTWVAIGMSAFSLKCASALMAIPMESEGKDLHGDVQGFFLPISSWMFSSCCSRGLVRSQFSHPYRHTGRTQTSKISLAGGEGIMFPMTDAKWSQGEKRPYMLSWCWIQSNIWVTHVTLRHLAVLEDVTEVEPICTAQSGGLLAIITHCKQL